MSDAARIETLGRLAEAEPQNELAHFSLGAALLEAGRPAEAAPSFQRVLALDSRNSKAYQLLGEAQKATGDTDLAIQTLTQGYRVARRNGDMMPMNAMANLLNELGAPVPTVGVQKEKETETHVSSPDGGFSCRRCGSPGPALRERPFKGELGERVLTSVCQSCWKEWVAMGTRVINELRLPMHDPHAQAEYDRHMKEFLSLD